MGEAKPSSTSAHAVEQWQWEDVPACPVCGSSKRRPFHKYVIDLQHFFVQCSSCGLLYLAPRPVYDAHFLSEMYEKDDHGPITGQVSEDFHTRVAPYYHNVELLSQVEKILPDKGALLDVGCNTGDSLLAARERGWDAHGIDISCAAVECCRKLGLDAACEDITRVPSGDKRYNVVTACHVIEHTLDPVSFLKALADRVHENGILVIEVPNIMGLDLRFKRWLEKAGLKKTRVHSPHHLYEFTYTAFKNLAAKVGLAVVACYTYSRFRRPPGIFKKLYHAFLKRVWTGNKFRFFLKKNA
jgi:2-polyprenyl-3-methyl-5-hydroxy-6-metoxy-1,4-benzoquinol methylase